MSAPNQTRERTRSSTETEELTGAEIVVRALRDEGVETVFGYPGGAVLYIYDELDKQDAIQHVLVRHEQAAVHAADAYSRSTGKIGVAWSPAARVLPMPLLALRQRTWTPFLWLLSLGKFPWR